MNHKISALMDGELSNEDTEELLGSLKKSPLLQQQWLSYHLIGDVLRQPDYVAEVVNAAFIERLHAEPTVLAPHGKRINKTEYVVMSAVASIMAMAFLTWISVQIDDDSTKRQTNQSSAVASSPVLPMRPGEPASNNVNDYLLAHQEFSPGTDVRGASSYLRTVSQRTEGAGR